VISQRHNYFEAIIDTLRRVHIHKGFQDVVDMTAFQVFAHVWENCESGMCVFMAVEECK